MIPVAVSLLSAALSLQAAPPAPTPPPAGDAPPVGAPERVPSPGRPQSTTPGAPAGAPSRTPTGSTPPPNLSPTPPIAPALIIDPPMQEDGTYDAPPPIEAEPPVLDFGFIAPRATATGSFKLWNRGKKPILILAVQPSCKCTTTSDLADKVILPGEFLLLETSLEGSPLPAPKKASLKILADGYQRVLELQIKGEVAYPLRAPPGWLNVVSGQPQQGRLLVEAIDKMPFRICSIQGGPAEYIGFDPALDEPRSSYLVKWDITKFGGKIPGQWVIETDRPDCPVLPVRIRHESTIPQRPAFKLKEYSVNMGRVERGKTVEVEVLMEDPGEPIITAAAVSENARAEILGSEIIEGTLHVKVRITPKKDFEGLLYFPLAIYSQTKDMEVETFGIVRPTGSSGCGGS